MASTCGSGCSAQSFPQKDSVIAIFYSPTFFLKPKLLIEAESFCHYFIGVQVDLMQLPQTLPLKAWIDGNVLDKHPPLLWHHHQDSSHLFFGYKDIDHSLRNKRFVISMQRGWFSVHANQIFGVGCTDTSHHSPVMCRLSLSNVHVLHAEPLEEIRRHAELVDEVTEIPHGHTSCV